MVDRLLLIQVRLSSNPVHSPSTSIRAITLQSFYKNAKIEKKKVKDSSYNFAPPPSDRLLLKTGTYAKVKRTSVYFLPHETDTSSKDNVIKSKIFFCFDLSEVSEWFAPLSIFRIGHSEKLLQLFPKRFSHVLVLGVENEREDCARHDGEEEMQGVHQQVVGVHDEQIWALYHKALRVRILRKKWGTTNFFKF